MIVWTVYPSAVTSRWDKSAADSAWDFCSAALPCPWSAESVAQLYKCRWRIEVFFKQIKQTLQLADFLGTSANAVRWQIWTALLVYLLLRYLAFLSDWSHSFSRLFALVRTGV